MNNQKTQFKNDKAILDFLGKVDQLEIVHKGKTIIKWDDRVGCNLKLVLRQAITDAMEAEK